MPQTKVLVGLASCGIAAGAAKVFDTLQTYRTSEKTQFRPATDWMHRNVFPRTIGRSY